MAAYLIQDATMTAIANQVRRLTGTNAPLSPAQIAAALAAFSPGSGDEDFDSFRFYVFSNGLSGLGNNGYDEDGNALTPLTALSYLERYMCGPASTTYSGSILSKFNPTGIQSGAQSAALAEIKMPACTSIGTGYWDDIFAACENLVSAYFPACMSVDEYAFRNCVLLESLTLNSACAISYGAFANVLSPNNKTFTLYLRGNTMGTCEDSAFDISPTGDSDYESIIDLYSAPIPGLEIYVPASLLNDFKTTWAGGIFADNIYALTD